METKPTTSAAQNRKSSQRRGQATSDRRRSGVPPNRGVPQVPPNLIITVLPHDPLKMIFRTLPASNLFVAPVCRRFRDVYAEAITEKKKKHTTCKYSLASEAALHLYLKEMKKSPWESSIYYTPKAATSMIGAGYGRTDWVERGGVFNESTCHAAALGGQLRILKWLRDRYCSWDIQTCEGAASNGHLEVLKWAWVNGCKWDSSTCFNAAYGGHLRVLKAAIRNGCPYKEHDFETYISDPDFHEWFGEYKANNSNQA
mmetsp:Transcript_18620/g.37060  ORF Transcript_18620/g.37060 Transcript_18620/m.37060 type:complete len:257 (-) Transcript_18620:27-797(-)